MRDFPDLDALRSAKGSPLGTSEWHEITQREVDQFAEATGDHQWIHVDPERAARGPFGGTIAHGFLTLSLLPALNRELWTVDGVTMAVNYGLDKVRLPAPVPVGSRVRSHAELVDVIDVPRGVRITVRSTVEIEGADKPACVVDQLVLLVVAPG